MRADLEGRGTHFSCMALCMAPSTMAEASASSLSERSSASL